MFGIDGKALRVTWTVFLFGFILFLVYSIRETLLVFSAAVLFAYVLSPIVALIERFLPKRRAMALSLVYVVLLGALVGLGFALIPKLAAEATSLLTRLPALVMSGRWATLPLPSWANPVRGQIMEALNKQAAGLEQHVVPFIQEAGSRILSEVGSLVPMILVPIVAFFFLKDARTIKVGLLGLARGPARVKLAGIINGVHGMLQSYMKALVILAAASFVAWVIFLNILGEPYALLLSGLAGVLEFVPVIGPAAALIIILLVSSTSGVGGVAWVIVFWILNRVFQDYVLNPFLMSSGVEIHPVLVLFGVLAGDQLGGIPGMFYSVPVLAILKVVLNNLSRSTPEREISRSATVADSATVVSQT
jgi:predicted PurR-regulated permease PerM